MFQSLCLLLVLVAQALAASTAGRKFCSGDLLKGFVENGEDGCCLPEGLCHDPVKTKKLAEHLKQINKPTIRKKRSLDVGSHLRDHLMSRVKNMKHDAEEGESQTLMAPLEFDDKTTDSVQTCPMGCTVESMELCPSSVSLAFPLFGTSVTKKKKVHIIQAGQMFDQPVVRRVCKHKSSAIIQGNCKQIYQPQLMFIAPDTSGVASMDLDYVYVESGCEATAKLLGKNDSSDSSSSSSSELLESLEGSSPAEENGLEGRSKDEKTENESPLQTAAPPEPTAEPEHDHHHDQHDAEMTTPPGSFVVPAEVPAKTHVPEPTAEPEPAAAEGAEVTTAHYDIFHDPHDPENHDIFHEDPGHEDVFHDPGHEEVFHDNGHEDPFHDPDHHELDAHPTMAHPEDLHGSEELASSTTTVSP